MGTLKILLPLALVALITACGDSNSSSDAPAAPKMVSAMKMAGALHVSWEPPTSCDAVELERKEGDGAFALAYELPGSVDNKHDAAATQNLVYTYRARCKVGATFTAYSNEISNNPM